MDRTLAPLSKFLSYVLRHRPDAIGVTLDPHGWVDIDELVQKSRAHGKTLSRELIAEIAERSPKKRFAISEDGRKLRASQGHSVDIDLAYEPSRPPIHLFHGTVAAHLPAIRSEGLKRMGRHHVHLSPDRETAVKVGSRRGRPIVLVVAAETMHAGGHLFYLAENGVWLVDRVPPEFIEFPPT